MIKVVTGNNRVISPKVTLGYLICRGIPFFVGLIRGKLRSFGFKKIGKKFFLGSHTRLLLKQNMTFGNNVRIGDYTSIDALSKSGIIFGDGVKIGDYSKIIGSGSISNIGEGLYIGNNSFFSEYTFFGAAGGIKIGNDVISGQNVRFHAENHKYSESNILIRNQGVSHLGIKIGNNCWIGAGAVFLDGSEIGDGCVVAANSVVTKKFPNNVIIGGIPAKIIKAR